MLAAQAGLNVELVFVGVTTLVKRQIAGWAFRAEGVG